MGNLVAVPDLVSEHELSEDAVQSVPDLVSEYEASQSRQNSVPDLVSLHEAGQNPSTFSPPSSNSSRQFQPAAGNKVEPQPYREGHQETADRPFVPLERQAAAPEAPQRRSIPKPAAATPRGKSNVELAQKDASTASTLPGAGPFLTLAEQKKAAATNPEIAKYPQNQPAPDPDYIARRKAWEAIATQPGAPDFDFDPEQERRIQAQQEAEAGRHPAFEFYSTVRDPWAGKTTGRKTGKTSAQPQATPVIGTVLEGAQAGLVTPFEKASAAGGKTVGEMTEGGMAASIYGQGQFAQPGEAVDPESGLPLPRAEDYAPENVARLRQEHPAIAGVSRAVGSAVGGLVADPRMWPFFLAGPEVSAALRTGYGAGFTGQMGAGAIQQAGQLQKIMDRADIPQDQKWELGAGAILSAIMAGVGAEGLAHDFSHLPATDQAQIRQRIRAQAPELAAQVDRLATPLASVPNDAATQAMLDHQRANGDLGSPQAATQAMLEFENNAQRNSAQQPAPGSQPPNKTTQQPAIGNQATVSSQTAPRGNNALSSAQVEGMAKTIASHPEAERGALIDDLHHKLTQWIVANKGKVVVHGRIELAKTPEQAEVLAQRIINDAVAAFDKKSIQQSASSTQPNQISVQGGQEAHNAGVQTSPAAPAQIAPMGRGMTTDSPVVRRVEQEAQAVAGQEPLVMVKKESPQDARALAEPAQPAPPEAVAKIGERDETSGRQIVQPSNSELQNERLAGEAAPELATKLSELAASIPGAKFDRLRPQKNLERIEEKVKEYDKPPRTIQDYLAGQIAADKPQAKDQLIAELKNRFKVISVEDKFLEGRPELAGYPSANVQVQMSNGSTAEVQIVPREVQQVTDLSHRYYTDGRKAELEGNLAARDWNHVRAAEINRRALEAFKRRNASGSFQTHNRASASSEDARRVVDGDVVDGSSNPSELLSVPATAAPSIAKGDRVTLADARAGVLRKVFPQLKSARVGFDDGKGKVVGRKSLVSSSSSGREANAARSADRDRSKGKAPPGPSGKQTSIGRPIKGGLGVYGEKSKAAGRGSTVREGTFSISDWSGYPANRPKPIGPHRLIKNAEYNRARKAADAANRRQHAADPSLAAKQIHEIHPVKFGGSPTDPKNKLPLSRDQHTPLTSWWRKLQTDLEQ